MMPKRKISAEDLYQLQSITGFSLSSQGQQIIYALQRIDPVSQKKYSNLWLASAEGDQSAQQFTQGNQVDSTPQISPDGSQVAFFSNRDVKQPGQKQIYLMPLNGGEARVLSQFKGDLKALSWSPDGKTLLCLHRPTSAEVLEREADAQKKELGVVARHITDIIYKSDGYGFLLDETWQIWLIEAETGQAKQISQENYDVNDPAFSPDGSEIVFSTNRNSDPGLNWDDLDLFIISISGGEPRLLNTESGPKNHPRFSPDGQWVAYLQQGNHQHRWMPDSLCLTPTDGSAPAQNLIAEFDTHAGNATLGDCADILLTAPTWSNDGQTLYFQVSQHGRTVLQALNIADKTLATITPNAGVIGQFTFTKDQEILVYLQGTLSDPCQIWRQDMASGEAVQITRVNQWLANEIDLGQIEEVWFKGPDDNDLQGWILTPPDFEANQTYPSILEIHGGPMNQYGQAFMHEFYFLAAQGYVVYFCNPRGGHGYGAEHCRAIYNDWGNKDYADLMAWADYVAQKPYIDVERRGVTGGSYGGYMTNWIIARTHQFKAAVTQRCVSNMVSMIGSSDLAFRFQALFGGTTLPWDDIEHYWKMSPLSQIGQVKTPTLVVHSESDLRCHIEQGEQVFVALKRLGVPTEMVRFPGEPHGLSRGGRTDRRVARLQHILRWFNQYLLAD